MIYIIDNAGRYTEHRIYFVSTEFSFRFVSNLVKATFHRSEAQVIGMAEKISWFRGGTLSLEEFLAPFDYRFSDIDEWRELVDPELFPDIYDLVAKIFHWKSGI
jgi:hypothetical protein